MIIPCDCTFGVLDFLAGQSLQVGLPIDSHRDTKKHKEQKKYLDSEKSESGLFKVVICNQLINVGGVKL